MGESPYEEDLRAAASNQSVTTDHFGGNIVSASNTIRVDGPFQEAVGALGISSLRYPGGTVTEQYFDPLGSTWEELFGPDQPDFVTAPDGKIIVGPSAFFEYASVNGLAVDFVLPTASLLTTNDLGEAVVDPAALAEIQATVAGMLRGNYGDFDLNTLEIGNEYYYFADLTAAEYGLVANELILALGEEFRSFAASGDAPPNWTPPSIAVQAGAAWQNGDNEAIIAALDMDARELVNEVVVHYYPVSLEDVDVRDRNLDQIDDWESAQGFEHLDFFVSEWNVQSVDGGDTGLAQGSTIIAAFDEMLVEGVDSAAIWGVQSRWLNTSLSSLNGSDTLSNDPATLDTRLTIPGEVIASLIESTLGLKPFDPNLDTLIDSASSVGIGASDPNADIAVNAFGSGGRVVFYISSRSAEAVSLSLNLEGYFGATRHVWGEVLTSVNDPSTPAQDESSPLSERGLPQFETLSSADLDDGATVVLEPYSILRVSVQLDGSGVNMQGHDPLVENALNYDDLLVGSDGDDLIKGHAGNDTIIGGLGSDDIHGGEGSDRLEGGGGNDLLRGGAGDDSLRGHWANDVLSGNHGSDTLFGGENRDILTGGSGNDTLFGGAGNDTIVAGEGDDTVYGGEGSDYLIVRPDGDTVIRGWDFEGGDRVTFLGQFDSIEQFEASVRETVGTNDHPGNLVVTNEAGFDITFEGAAGRLEDLKSQVVDFQAEGQAALDLSERLNLLSSQDINSYLDSLSTEEFDEKILVADPIILMSNLEAETAAHFLNGMGSDEIELFLSDVGEEGIGIFFEDLELEEVDTFVSEVSGPALVELLDIYGAPEILSQVEECGRVTETTFFEKLAGTKYETLNPVVQWGHDEPPDDDSPWRPDPEEPDPDSNQEDDDEVTVRADCFVATVVYADGDHPEVWLLRWYRDRVLRNSRLGRFLILVYWTYGPGFARFVYARPMLGRAFRTVIHQIVNLISLIYGRTPGRQLDHPVCEDSRLMVLRRSKHRGPFDFRRSK